jgi:hypothetical protein
MRQISEQIAGTLEHDTRCDVGWMPLTGSDPASGMLVFKELRGVVSAPSTKKNTVNRTVIYQHGLTFLPSRRRRIKRAEKEIAYAEQLGESLTHEGVYLYRILVAAEAE